MQPAITVTDLGKTYVVPPRQTGVAVCEPVRFELP